MKGESPDALRRYAAGELARRQLNDGGWTYSEVLDGLGALGLRPPITGDEGPNVAALARGRALVRDALFAMRRFVDGNRLVSWINRRSKIVRIVPTSRAREWLILKEAGERAKGFGELTAIGVVDSFSTEHPAEQSCFCTKTRTWAAIKWRKRRCS